MVSFIVILCYIIAFFAMGYLVGYLRGLKRGWLNDQRMYASCRAAARIETENLREQVRVLRQQLDDATRGDPMR